MPGSFVIDASVAAKLRFLEAGSSAAIAAAQAADSLIAPDFLHLEMASVAAKNVRSGRASLELALEAVETIGDILEETAPSGMLSRRAFQLAAEHGFSAYDGAYLALAEMRRLPVLTADMRLVRRAREQGFSHLVHASE